MNICNQCPRKCNIDRTSHVGFCGETQKIKIAKVMTHFWEEPIISGCKGSGAIFFSGCNLKCVFCQNYQISHQSTGKEYSIEQFVELLKTIESKGVHNINLVSPSQFTEQILSALKIYKPKIPIIWNSNGYELKSEILKLGGYVDIFLCDFKYFSNNYSLKYSSAPLYFEHCTNALLAMRKICPQDTIQDGLMKKGLIVRHLVMPTLTIDSINILNWIKDNLGEKTYISLMSQYTPFGDLKNHKEINRGLKPIEYKIVLKKLYDLGFENGYTQDLKSASTEFIPEFKKVDIDQKN